MDSPELDALKRIKQGAKVETQQGVQEPLQGRSDWIPESDFETDTDLTYFFNTMKETREQLAELAEDDDDCVYSDLARAETFKLIGFLAEKLRGYDVSFGLVSGNKGSPCIVVQNSTKDRRLDIDISPDGQFYQVVYQNLDGIQHISTRQVDPESLIWLLKVGSK